MARLKCECGSTDFTVYCYEVIEQQYDGEKGEWGNTDFAEEAFLTTAQCDHCGKDITARFDSAAHKGQIAGLLPMEHLRRLLEKAQSPKEMKCPNCGGKLEDVTDLRFPEALLLECEKCDFHQEAFDESDGSREVYQYFPAENTEDEE